MYTLEDYLGEFNILAAEKHLIMLAMLRFKKRREQATALGISLRGLHNRMDRHGIR